MRSRARLVRRLFRRTKLRESRKSRTRPRAVSRAAVEWCAGSRCRTATWSEPRRCRPARLACSRNRRPARPVRPNPRCVETRCPGGGASSAPILRCGRLPSPRRRSRGGGARSAAGRASESWARGVVGHTSRTALPYEDGPGHPHDPVRGAVVGRRDVWIKNWPGKRDDECQGRSGERPFGTALPGMTSLVHGGSVPHAVVFPGTVTLHGW
jgi:hypothetical protein